ncbi:hypothetical protein [Ferdinandcohnia sp. SAFN-114]|uniref:hypothetical protein n=1 Tax=Ferdinandcohnia sp. SAFN-114 TaxID=3387275 RepID=UPI003F7F9BBB
MEMDVYDYESYQMSIQNLLMLKLFHDEGINVSNFPNYMTHINYGDTNSLDIFTNGMNQLFENTIHFDYGDVDSKEFKELFEDLVGGDGPHSVPEFAYVIKDPLFELLLNSPYSRVFEKLLKGLVSDDMNVCECIVLPNRDGIGFLFEFYSQFHNVAEDCINLKHEAMKLKKQYKREIAKE